MIHHDFARTIRNTRRNAISRPVNECPPNYSFLYSRCSRFHGPGTWTKVCRAPEERAPGQGLSWGTCSESEICIDGRTQVHHNDENYIETLAWCVDVENAIALTKLLAGEATGGTVISTYHVNSGTQASIGAVLTTTDSQTLINAQNIEIQAQTADQLGGIQSWRTLNGGDQQCNSCSSLSLLQVPEGTERVKVTVNSPGSKNGLLNLAAVGS